MDEYFNCGINTPMINATREKIISYRLDSFRILKERRIKTREEAIDFVNERGFIFFWPITGITFPSLWVAAAGDRPVASEHNDPGHITWSWKDELLGKGEWYYAKILRKKATLISMEVVKHFYALSDNYGSFEDDYLTLYEQGRITQTARQIYKAILDNGPLDTVTLRLITQAQGLNSSSQFDRAIRDLQADLKLLPVGVSDSGRWHYAFIYDIAARHYPQIPLQANEVRDRDARIRLVEIALSSLGGVQISDLIKLFGWKKNDLYSAIDELKASDKIYTGADKDQKDTVWLFSRELI